MVRRGDAGPGAARMNYPTPDQVMSTDREQVYRWFLLLPMPRFVKDKKTKVYVEDPPGGTEIIKLISDRWTELGGRDHEIGRKIISEVYNDTLS